MKTIWSIRWKLNDYHFRRKFFGTHTEALRAIERLEPPIRRTATGPIKHEIKGLTGLVQFANSYGYDS